MNEEKDLSEGFPEYEKSPKDVVSKGSIADPSDIPTGPATAVVSYDITDDGITRTEEHAFIARPIMPKTADD